jgi:hypothetical protein
VTKNWRQEDHEGHVYSWLLEDSNPSARYLTLRHLMAGDERSSEVVLARQEISAWPPVRELIELIGHENGDTGFQDPFYGGALSLSSTLSVLADLGTAAVPAVQTACERLLEYGQHDSGGFGYDGAVGRLQLCRTGMALHTLLYFGYGDEPDVRAGLRLLTAASVSKAAFRCPYNDGEECHWALVKALKAFAQVPTPRRTAEQNAAAKRLAERLLEPGLDLEGRDSGWLELGFPLDDRSDLVELCDVLARLQWGPVPRFRRLLDRLSSFRTQDGKWVKARGARSLTLETVGQPSKWITIYALRALKSVDDSRLAAELVRWRSRELFSHWEKTTRRS